VWTTSAAAHSFGEGREPADEGHLAHRVDEPHRAGGQVDGERFYLEKPDRCAVSTSPDSPTPIDLTPPVDLAAALTELTGLVLAMPNVESLLTEVARLAARVLNPPASCGITLRRDHEPYTAATSDALAAHVDEVQYGEHAGPCLQTLDTGEQVYVRDLSAETRWGGYPTHALGYGIRSSLSLPLSGDGHTRGALNLYALTTEAFGPDQRNRAGLFAAQAGAALAIVTRQVRQVELSDQLRHALASRAVIDRAIGVIIGQRRCTAEAAFDVLRDISQRQNRKLRDIAAEIVQGLTGRPAAPGPFNEPPR
jgi:transcriptional regulator with GAF, ATPase, and Fis domain